MYTFRLWEIYKNYDQQHNHHFDNPKSGNGRFEADHTRPDCCDRELHHQTVSIKYLW